MVLNDGKSEEGMGWGEADGISGVVHSVGEGAQDYGEGGGLCWRWLGWCLKKCQSEKRSILLRIMAVAGRANCLLVTGPPGVGKTIWVMRVMEMLWHRVDGRYGRLASTIVSSAESHKWPNVGKYRMDLTSFELLALLELQVKENIDLFIIDEVGKMELYSSSFFPAVKRVR